jgi:large subunit ribosomal protein L18
MVSKTKVTRRVKLKYGIRKKVNGTAERPRLCVYRSNSNINAQLIDDATHTTLAGVTSAKLGTKGNKTEVAKAVGAAIAQKASELGLKAVVFDRNGFLYHGRVKALADAARENGLEF